MKRHAQSFNFKRVFILNIERNINHPSSRLLTYPDVSEMTGLSISTLRRWVKSGDFPLPIIPAKNKAVRFKASDIHQWISER